MIEISQRELRNDNAEIMRRVAAGESFTVTRHGTPIADLIPHRREPDSMERRHRPLGEILAEFRKLPPMDVEKWYAERAEDDKIFGPDDPFDTP